MEAYVKTGLTGYGPELDTDDVPLTDLQEVCGAICDELDRSTSGLDEAADAAGEAEDYRTAWLTHKLAERLEILRMNLDWDRRVKAYVSNVPALTKTMYRLIAENFPLDITLEGNVRLYVWDEDETLYRLTGK